MYVYMCTYNYIHTHRRYIIIDISLQESRNLCFFRPKVIPLVQALSRQKAAAKWMHQAKLMDEIPQPLDPLLVRLVSTGHKHELTCQKKSKNNMSCAKLRANNHPQICGLFDEVMCREIRFDHTGKLWRFTWFHPPAWGGVSPQLPSNHPNMSRWLIIPWRP